MGQFLELINAVKSSRGRGEFFILEGQKDGILGEILLLFLTHIEEKTMSCSRSLGFWCPTENLFFHMGGDVEENLNHLFAYEARVEVA